MLTCVITVFNKPKLQSTTATCGIAHRGGGCSQNFYAIWVYAAAKGILLKRLGLGKGIEVGEFCSRIGCQ